MDDKANKTNWENIVHSEELKSVKKNRAKSYIESKERASALSELILEGWVKVKDYKGGKYIKVKKEKPDDEKFEDEIWLLFCNMGFTYLNSDRRFKISYDFHNENLTQQIDVFAADEETVILIECKAANSPKAKTFKKELEAFHGQYQGLVAEIHKKFPKRKIKQIFATKNYDVGNKDKERMADWGITHFSEKEVQYYSELVKHLGSAAKYQLLGNLFANQRIKNIDNRIPAIRGKMGPHTYYSFSIEPEKLLKIGYVLHRSEANNDMMPTYQRIIKKARLTSVRNFINDSGYFPNSIVISIDSKKKLQFDEASPQVDGSVARIGILHLPQKYRSAYIIDGQHRLYGYSDSKYAKTNSIPVVAFENLDKKEQIKLFMEINENQKSVSKNLRNTLNADTQWDSDSLNEKREAIKLRIAQKLGESHYSPLYDRIIIGEDVSTTKKCITIESVRLALSSSLLLSKYNSKNLLERIGTMDYDNSEKTFDYIYEYLKKCFSYLKEFLPDEWEKGKDDNGILTINNGIGGIIGVLNSIVQNIVEIENCDIPLSISSEELFEKSKYYLDSVVRFYESIDQEKREAIKKTYGGNGPVFCCRNIERFIHEEHPKFNPDGLEKYWEEHSSEYNSETIKKISKIDECVREYIKMVLTDNFADEYIKEIPKKVYKKANEKMSNQKYETGKEMEFWEAISVNDCRDIIIYGSNWSTLFEKKFTVPSQVNISGGKKAKTEWLNMVYKLQNNAGKPTFCVSKKDYELICEIYSKFCE